LGKRTGPFQQPIGESRFAMVDMGNDGKIPYMTFIAQTNISINQAFKYTL
jgi:hypothetical protein